MNKRNKITIIAYVVVIIVGIIVALTAGFNVDMMTREHKQLQLNLKKEFEVADIKQITDEVFKGQTVEIQKVEIYEKQVAISTNDITEEQKNNLITKLNEKYGADIKAENTDVIIVPNVKVRDILSPYIVTFAIATALIIVYVALKYKKLGSLKVIAQMGLGIVLLEGVIMSLIAITRIPVGQSLPSIIFTTYAISVVTITSVFENKLQKIKEEETKKTEKKKKNEK